MEDIDNTPGLEDKSGDSGLWIWIIKGALLLVTGWMTASFLLFIMGPGKEIIAIVGVVAFEGGVLMWPHLYKNDAITKGMQAIAVVMILVTIAGIAIAMFGEIIRYNPEAAALMSWMAPVMPIFVGAIVIINVAAYTYFQLIHPKAALEREMRRLQLADYKIALMAARHNTGIKMDKARARYIDGGTPAKTNGVDPEADTDFLPPPAPGSPSSTRRAKSTPHSQPPR